MAEWRPEGWENPHSNLGPGFDLAYTAFEAGAEAMLEALKKKGALMTPEQMKLIAPDRQYPYGYLVFIPDAATKRNAEEGPQGG